MRQTLKQRLLTCSMAFETAANDGRHGEPPKGIARAPEFLMDDEFLTDDEICAELHVTPRTTMRWRRDGGGPPFTRVLVGAYFIRALCCEIGYDRGPSCTEPKRRNATR